MIGSFFLVLIGLISLVLGGELLVRGSSRIAFLLGVSPLVIGLTVVAFGTSAPEAAVSILSSLQGQEGIAIGNVVGSNIMNILVVLGLASLILPLTVHQQVVRIDAPLVVVVTILLAGLVLDGKIGRIDGVILFTGIILYTVWAIRKSRSESPEVQDEYALHFSEKKEKKESLLKFSILIIAGCVLLVLGSSSMVKGASSIAEQLGVSDLIIGLTIVSVGTSLPELATSLVAVIKKQSDIGVGNVVGSNLFNILLVLGLSGLSAPGGLSVPPEVISFDLWFMLGVSILTLPVFFSGYKISRWEGAFFLAFYALYLGYIILSASGYPSLLPTYKFSAFLVILPMTALMFGTAIHQLVLQKEKKPRGK